MSRKTPEPLPSDWLPEPRTRVELDDPEILESRIRRLVAAAEPTLASYRTGELAWWQALIQYWQPATAAALAGAIAAVLLLGPEGQSPGAPPTNDLVLTAAATDGDPAALWMAIGEQADPVLALIALAEEKQ